MITGLVKKGATGLRDRTEDNDGKERWKEDKGGDATSVKTSSCHPRHGCGTTGPIERKHFNSLHPPQLPTCTRHGSSEGLWCFKPSTVGDILERQLVYHQTRSLYVDVRGWE